jgi:glycosyltransferase involved in cell wall biosynthesis
MTKILAICSAIDLSEVTGSTPAWWQLFKALSELGCELIIIPYRGRSFDTLWWKAIPNPVDKPAKLAYAFIKIFIRRATLSNTRSKNIISRLYANTARTFFLNKWFKLLRKIWLYEGGNIDAVLMVQTPLNHLIGLPTFIHREFNVPVFYYDGDMPVNLYGSFTINYYTGADLGEYDGFIINSKGSEEHLRRLGARNVKTIYWGVDAEVFKPLPGVQKIYDIFFFGAGPQGREKDIEELFIKPSELLPHTRFAYAGGGGIWSWSKFATPTSIEYLGDMKKIRFIDYKRLCCSSKINLNITRSPHKDIYASSVSRLFELAALECCIVSNECKGIEEWFKVGKEVFVARDSKEAVELYKYLLDNEEARLEAGRLARERVLREHTSYHRARELLGFIKNFVKGGHIE